MLFGFDTGGNEREDIHSLSVESAVDARYTLQTHFLVICNIVFIAFQVCFFLLQLQRCSCQDPLFLALSMADRAYQWAGLPQERGAVHIFTGYIRV